MNAQAFEPWRIRWSMAGGWIVYCHNDLSRPHDLWFPKEREAEARLAASAPVLLKQLINARDALRLVGLTTNEADAAISEATQS